MSTPLQEEINALTAELKEYASLPLAQRLIPTTATLIAESRRTLNILLRAQAPASSSIAATEARAAVINVQEFKFPEPSERGHELTPLEGIGALLMNRTNLVKGYCDAIVSELPDYKNKILSHYWRSPRGSGKTTFLKLMGREMAYRRHPVYSIPYAEEMNDEDIKYIKRLVTKRPEGSKSVVLLLDETQDAVGKSAIKRLLKDIQSSLVLIATGIPDITFMSAHFEYKHGTAELFYTRDDLPPLVDFFAGYYPTLNRKTIKHICAFVCDLTGGHLFALLRICQHVMGDTTRDPSDYRIYLSSECFKKSKAYGSIISRCYTAIPSAEQLLRFLRATPTPDDVKAFEKLGLWNKSTCRFVSLFFKNHCFNELSPACVEEEEVTLPHEATAKEKIRIIIKTGLKHMTSKDFKEPSGDTFKYEDPIGNCWAYYIRRYMPSLYIAGQVQVNVSYQELSKERKKTRKTENDTTARLDFLFNGKTDVAIELVRNGQQGNENEKHWKRFSEQYEQWNGRSAVLNFQMEGKKVKTPEGAKLYTFLYETNELFYKNKKLVSTASSIPSINLNSGSAQTADDDDDDQSSQLEASQTLALKHPIDVTKKAAVAARSKRSRSTTTEFPAKGHSKKRRHHETA